MMTKYAVFFDIENLPDHQMLSRTFILLILGFFISGIVSDNTTYLSMDFTVVDKKKHFLSSYWPWQSLFGLIGTFLNCYVLYAAFEERHSLISSVNAMIW